MRRYHSRHRHDGTEVALANFALTFAKALLVFCVVLFLMIQPHDSDGVKQKAEYMITVDWSATHGRYDVDTWTKLPDGSKVMYENKESGIVYLERDDLGDQCKETTNNGTPTNACEEITVVRGVDPGRYQLALHLFSVESDTHPQEVAPIEVQVAIRKLNPTTTLVWQKTVTLHRVRQELPLARFVINQNGAMSDFSIDNLPPIIYDGSATEPSPPPPVSASPPVAPQ